MIELLAEKYLAHAAAHFNGHKPTCPIRGVETDIDYDFMKKVEEAGNWSLVDTDFYRREAVDYFYRREAVDYFEDIGEIPLFLEEAIEMFIFYENDKPQPIRHDWITDGF